MKPILKLILFINLHLLMGQQNSSINNNTQMNSSSINNNTQTNISVNCTIQFSQDNCINNFVFFNSSSSNNYTSSNNPSKICCWVIKRSLNQSNLQASFDSSCIYNPNNPYNTNNTNITITDYGNGTTLSTNCMASQIKIFFDCNFILILAIFLIIGI